MRSIFLFCSLLFFNISFSQTIDYLTQYNGRYEFTMLGNSLADAENTPVCSTGGTPTFQTTTSADLNLAAGQTVRAAYIYWSGSGSIDSSIRLDGNGITADESFQFSGGFSFRFYSSRTDITTYVQGKGNGTYTVEGIDFDSVNQGCHTRYAGWIMIVVYEDPAFTLNSVYIYDGLQVLSSGGTPTLNVNLSNLFVVNPNGAELGFLCFEGDSQVQNETARVNGNFLTNALNPQNNPFNSTNSYTGATGNNFPNMDLDFYDISPFVTTGDTNMSVRFDSPGDLVVFSAMAVTLNNELPDATITMDNITQNQCDVRSFDVDYTVGNINGNQNMAAGVPIVFYADAIGGTVLGNATTANDIPIGGTEPGSITLNVPASVPQDFTLIASINDDGTGNTVILELDVGNNDDRHNYRLGLTPPVTDTESRECDEGGGQATFDLDALRGTVSNNDANMTVTFHDTQALADADGTTLTDAFVTSSRLVYARIDDEATNCFNTAIVTLTVDATPTANTVQKWDTCDTDNNSVWTWDLTTRNTEVLGTQSTTEFEVLYFDADPATGATAIANPTTYQNTANNPQTIWALIRNRQNNTCEDVTSFQVEVFNTPTANNVQKWDECDTDNNNVWTWDLTTRDTEVLGTQSSTEFEVLYFDADPATSATPVANPAAYQNSTNNPQTIWALIRNRQNNACEDVTSFQVEVYQTPTANPVQDWNECDTDNNGVWTWDLTSRNPEVYGGQSTTLYDVLYFDADPATGATPIPNPAAYQNTNNNPQTIWALIRNMQNNICEDVTSFNVQVFNTPTAVDATIPIATCSGQATADFDLTLREDEVRDNVNSMIVYFYATRPQAENHPAGTPIANPNNYSSATGSVFAVIEDPNNNNCFNIAEITLEVLRRPERRDPTPIEECSATANADFNLDSVEPFIRNGAQNVTVTFHRTRSDANSPTAGGLNRITNTTAFNSPSAAIFARSEANYQGRICHNVSEVELIVNPLPAAVDYVYYECSTTASADFNLNNRKNVITGGQGQRTVTFFSDETGARMNDPALQITSPHNSTGEIIWARVVNDQTLCYNVAQIYLSVVNEPDLTENLTFSQCRIGTIATFDLDAERDNLIAKYPQYDFTFYEQQADAENQTGMPVQGQYQSEEKTIYTRISASATIDCYQVKAVQLKIIPTPFDDRGTVILCIGDPAGITLPNGEVVNLPGVYERIIPDPVNGCDILTRTNVIVGEILFPSAFTPNANSQNDIFMPLPNQQCALFVENYQMDIWNRWGEKVFESNTYTEGWDGSHAGRDALPGVYVWRVTYTFQGQDYEQKGSISLIR